MYVSNVMRLTSPPMSLSDLITFWKNITDIGQSDTLLCPNILPYRR
jgi:hypothetical protein